MGLMSWNGAYKSSHNIGNVPSVPTMIHEEFFKNSIANLKASHPNAMSSDKEGWKKKRTKAKKLVLVSHLLRMSKIAIKVIMWQECPEREYLLPSFSELISTSVP